MANDLALELIHDLRFDDHTRRHFSIKLRSGRGACETVGCIAGTVEDMKEFAKTVLSLGFDDPILCAQALENLVVVDWSDAHRKVHAS